MRRERLCRLPDHGAAPLDPVRIDCVLEQDAPSAAPALDAATLTVAAFNLERGFESEAQVRAFKSGAGLPLPDVLLLSEVDRGCSRSGWRNVARDYAEALGMHYVFGVEYVELPRSSGPGRRIEAPCEHGNGILSRWPIEDPEVLRFAANESWYRTSAGPGEPRLGGRMALAATLRVGVRRLRVFATHFESGAFDDRYRRAQADELARAVENSPHPVIVGGDFNLHVFMLDLLVGARLDSSVARFERAGLRDAHARVPLSARPTHSGLLVLDLILSDLETRAAGVGSARVWRGLSDHRPVWGRFDLPS